MTSTSLGIGLALALLAAQPALAGDKLLVGPPPAWVVQHSPPTSTTIPAEAKLPVQILQIDNQVHVEGKSVTGYSRIQIKFLTSQGLSAGNLSYAWSPDTDQLTVHKVLIHRGEKTIDVLASGQSFTILRREQDLEQATLTGMLTANLFPEGLQVGDILEAEITRSTTNPVTGNHAEQIFRPLNLPAGRIDVSVEWPKDKPMRLARSGDLPEWTRGLKGGFETASISLDNVQPLLPPRGAPARFAMLRMGEATDYKSWAEVADIFVPLYKKASQIPADGPLRAELEAIRAASNDPVRRAEGALQLVESHIRYVALEMGTGGLVPADAAQTWARRFGDCKAKTALLLGLLGELGIQAEPVVVSTEIGDALNDRLPAVGLFNHILVRATIGGRAYWLDGTRTGDTSLARLTTPNFGWGLPIGKGSATLVRMLPPPLEQPQSDLTIELDAAKGIHAPVPAKLELTLRGDAALGLDQGFTSLAGSERDRAQRQYWRNRFDFIEPEKYDFAFDDKTGELHLTMRGTATLEWKDGWYETDETGVGYRADFSRPAGRGSDAPFAVDYPTFDRTRETILLPASFTGKPSSDGTEINETVAGIEYRRHVDVTPGRVTIERTSRSLVPEIAAKDAIAAQKRLRALSDDAVYLQIPSSYRATSADLVALAAETPDDDAKGQLDLANAYLDAGNSKEALARLVRATTLDSKNAVAWAERGIAEAYLGKLSDASASLDKAAAIEPANKFMLRGRGVVADQRQAYTVAIDAYSKVIAQDPKDEFAFAGRARANFRAGNMDAALDDAQKAVELEPADTAMYGLRAYVFTSRKMPEQAFAEVQRMMAANPGKPEAAAEAKRLLAALGMADKAATIAGTPGEAPTTARGFLVKAMLREAKDFDGRLADFNQALKLEPDLLPALQGRGELLYGQGKYDAALADADRAIGLNPHEVGLYLLKANALRALGRPDDSLAVAKAVADANPEVPLAHVVAGKIYQAFDRHAEAVAAIDHALALAPEPYMYLNRADIRPVDDLTGRMADVELALKRDANFTPALAMKADILSRKGDHAAAAQLYDAVVANEPAENSYLVARGIERWRAGRQADAEEDFAAADDNATGPLEFNSYCYQKAVAGIALETALNECNRSLQLLPDVAAVLDSRGTVYLQMGHYQEAKADYDRALAKDPALAPSLVGRAIARLHLGDAAGARADIAAARKASPGIVDSMRASGIAIPADLAT